MSLVGRYIQAKVLTLTYADALVPLPIRIYGYNPDSAEAERVRRIEPPLLHVDPYATSVALARYILDNPYIVRGHSVLDLGAGVGLASIAAAKAGAREVTAVENDFDNLDLIEQNAKANAVHIHAVFENATSEYLHKPSVVLAAGLLHDSKHDFPELLQRLSKKGKDVIIASADINLADTFKDVALDILRPHHPDKPNGLYPNVEIALLLG